MGVLCERRRGLHLLAAVPLIALHGTKGIARWNYMVGKKQPNDWHVRYE